MNRELTDLPERSDSKMGPPVAAGDDRCGIGRISRRLCQAPQARDISARSRAALVRKATGMEHVPDAIWEGLAKQWAKSHVPGLERVAKAEEIAVFALVLASDDHPYM